MILHAGTTKSILRKCDEVSAVMKSIAHPVRLKILCRVMDGECSVSDLTEFCEISQSAMSQFLKRMKNEGLLQSRRERNFIFYSIADQKIVALLKATKNIYC